jgi:hypothetical protein
VQLDGTNHNLTLSSFRSTFADGLVPRPRVSRPVSAYPRYGDAGNDAEEGGGDRWLEWEFNDLPKLAKELTLKQGCRQSLSLVVSHTQMGGLPEQRITVTASVVQAGLTVISLVVSVVFRLNERPIIQKSPPRRGPTLNYQINLTRILPRPALCAMRRPQRRTMASR